MNTDDTSGIIDEQWAVIAAAHVNSVIADWNERTRGRRPFRIAWGGRTRDELTADNESGNWQRSLLVCEFGPPSGKLYTWHEPLRWPSYDFQFSIFRPFGKQPSRARVDLAFRTARTVPRDTRKLHQVLGRFCNSRQTPQFELSPDVPEILVTGHIIWLAVDESLTVRKLARSLYGMAIESDSLWDELTELMAK